MFTYLDTLIKVEILLSESFTKNLFYLSKYLLNILTWLLKFQYKILLEITW